MRPRLAIALGAAAMIGLAGASLAISEAGSPTADLVVPAGAGLLGAPDTSPALPGLSPGWVLSTLQAAATAETPPAPAVRPAVILAAPPAVEAAAPEPMPAPAPAPRPAHHSAPVLVVLTSVPIPVTLPVPSLPPVVTAPVVTAPVSTPPSSPSPSTGHHRGSGHGHSGSNHGHHHGGHNHH